MTGRAWSLALALCVVAAGGPLVWRAGEAPAHATTDRLARRLVTDIVAGRNAGRALCQLYSLRRYYGRPRYEPTPCTAETIRTIAASPDADRTVYAAVTAPAWKPESPEGVLAFFDDRGFLLPVFAGANMVSNMDSLFEYRPGHSAVALDVPTGTADRGSDEYETVLVLHIVPLARRQRPLLSVIVGPPTRDMCQGPGWGWRLRDTDGDDVPEIEIGPHVDASGAIAPRAVYRWSADAGEYVGPNGSPAEGFQRTDRLSRATECCSHHVTDFAQAVRALASPPEPGISGDACERGAMETITIY